MQSNITLNKFLRKALQTGLYAVLLMVLSLNSIYAQTTTITTSPPYPVTSANAEVTFNFTNNNSFSISISDITSVVNLLAGKADVSGFYKPGAIAGLPGVINGANGWIQFGAATVTTNGLRTPQSFFSSNLIIPAGATYGIAIRSYREGTTTGALLYSNAPVPATFTAGGATFTTGANVGYAGAANGNAPTVTPRGFTGSISFVPSTPCAGMPPSGNTVSSIIGGSCTGVGFTISSSTVSAGADNISYQLQSASTLAGTYTNVGSALPTSFFNISQNVTTAYRIVATCANGGATTTFTPVLVNANNVCYCAAGATNTSPDFEKISNVTFSNINRNTPATNFNGYVDYTTDTAKVIQGGTYPISVTGNGNTYDGDIVAVWIDFNQNGIFTDPGENVYRSAASAGPYTSNITIPSSALLGTTRMRIRLYDGTFGVQNSSPCGNATYGQVQDFSVQIIPCIPVTFTTQPTAQSVACQGTATFTAAVNANGSFPVFQWQFRTSSTGVFQNVPNTSPYSGANTNTLTISNVSSNMSGYEYRVSISGLCSAANPSNSATLTVSPLIATVSPAGSTICAGSIQQLVITNTAPPSTVQFCSGNINLAIPDVAGPPVSTPDAADAGINHSIPVVIPTGALIASINVKLNVTHTYIGDLVVVLKAPNGKILNLIYHKSGTGGGASGGGANFLNTIISSAGTASISSGSSPFTGTFKADASVGPGSYADVAGSGPTAFQPDVTTFNSLFSIPNGNWTIAIADHREWAGDVGVLNNWCIEFNYGAPATGVFTGPAGTIFTDATATTPYTGTPINTVFVKPTAAGTFNYAVVVSNTLCTTDTLRLPIAVNSPAGGSPTLTSTSVCAGNNTFLKLGGTLTGGPGFVHNFQVKVPGATTFTNITAGGIYNVNRDTLKLTSVPISFNGYQFRDSISTGANCGSVISSVATLTVNPIPVVTISAAPRRNLFPGLTTTLTAAVSSATGPITYQWFRNGVLVPGATNSTLVVGIDGVGLYTVKVTAQGCSSADSTTTPQSITIGDSTGVTKLFIYPSPNNGKFQVRYFSDINNGSKNPAMLNVYDEKGTRVFSKFYGLSSGYQQMNVDLGGHASGIYRVELSDLNGDRIKTGSVFVF